MGIYMVAPWLVFNDYYILNWIQLHDLDRGLFQIQLYVS